MLDAQTLPLVLDRPIVSFDLETTGLNIDRDQIVEIACVKIFPDGQREVRTKRLCPDVPIGEEAMRVHGIRPEDVADAPSFGQVARGLLDFLAGCDLTGFNLGRFDLPILQAEFRRAGMEFPLEGTRIVDSRSIFVQQEPRTLAAAHAFYCGMPLDQAHSAEADAVAAADVLLAQLRRYDDVPKSVAGLHDYCVPPDFIDQSGKVRWQGADAVLAFGRYRNRPLRDVAADDPDYLRWVAGADFPSDTVNIVKEALDGTFPARAAA